MDFFNGIGKKLSETAKTVSKKSEELVEVTKLNLAIGSEEEKIKKLCEELGSEIYKEYKKGKSFGSLFDERCNFIKQCELNIEDLRIKIQALKGVNLCKTCGQSLEQDIKFCPHCGAKQEIQSNTNDDTDCSIKSE